MRVWACCERIVKRRTTTGEQTLWTLNPFAHADWRNRQGLCVMQGLDDHCHMPTLEVLPRDIPVVAQATAAAACRYVSFLLRLMADMSLMWWRVSTIDGIQAASTGRSDAALHPCPLLPAGSWGTRM